MAAPSINAAVEGANFSDGTPTASSRLSNWAQIIRKDIKVTGSQVDAFRHAGVSDEFANQKSLKMLELVRDEEMSLLHATGNSGTSAAARVMKGIMSSITTRVDTGTATNNSTVLTETRFNNQLQNVYANSGGRPDLVVVDPFNKRQISAFTGGTGSARQIDQETKTLYNTIDKYNSDFGDEKIIPHYMLGAAAPSGAQTNSGTVLLLDSKHWRKAFARPLQEIEIGAVGDSYVTAILEELTLEALAEQFSAKMTGYTTS